MRRDLKKDILPQVHEILRRQYGDLNLISGQGVAKGERVEFTEKGRRTRCVIKTSRGGRISFGHRDGKWSGLDESDHVVIVAPTALGHDGFVVSMFDQQTMRDAFNANHAAQEKAGMGALPNWIAPFHEEGRGPRGTGDGFGGKALWSEPLSSPTTSVANPSDSKRKTPLTIQEAKRELSISLGVPMEAIEIIVRA